MLKGIPGPTTELAAYESNLKATAAWIATHVEHDTDNYAALEQKLVHELGGVRKETLERVLNYSISVESRPDSSSLDVSTEAECVDSLLNLRELDHSMMGAGDRDYHLVNLTNLTQFIREELAVVSPDDIAMYVMSLEYYDAVLPPEELDEDQKVERYKALIGVTHAYEESKQARISRMPTAEEKERYRRGAKGEPYDEETTDVLFYDPLGDESDYRFPAIRSRTVIELVAKHAHRRDEIMDFVVTRQAPAPSVLKDYLDGHQSAVSTGYL